MLMPPSSHALPHPSTTVSPATQLALSLVIPCYNEATTIQDTVEILVAYMTAHFPKLLYELILVDDGSTDETAAILGELSAAYPSIRCHRLPYNQGRGAAIKAGIATSTGEKLILLDADLSYDVDHISEILHCFAQEPKTDVVVVSAYMPGGTVEGVPADRLFVSRMANWILSGFFASNLSTVTCVVRGYRGEKIRNMPLFEDGKQLHLEILRKMALSDAVIREIPGRLIWKQHKQVRRKNNLNVTDSAKKHLLYGLLVKPTRLFKYIGVLLLLFGLYEAGTIFYNVVSFYQPDENLLKALSLAIKTSFFNSPHTFILAAVGLILGFQTFSFLALLEINRMQHEESLRHQLELLSRLPPKS